MAVTSASSVKGSSAPVINAEPIESINQIAFVYLEVIPKGTPMQELREKCFQAVLQDCLDSRWDRIHQICVKGLGKGVRNGNNQTVFGYLLEEQNRKVIAGLLSLDQKVQYAKELAGDEFHEALHLAVKKGDYELANLLSSEEYLHYFSGENREGKTALHLAIEEDAVNMVALLLRKGMSLKFKCSWRGIELSPLALCIALGRIECFSHLVEVIKNPWVIHTPKIGNFLHVAVYFNQIFALNELLTHYYKQTKSLIEARSEEGMTPLLLAASLGFSDGISLLYQHGATLDCQGREGHTPLYLAAVKGDKDTIALLLHKGINTSSFDERAIDPDTMAFIRRSTEQMRMNQFAFPNFAKIPAENLIFAGGAPQATAYISALKTLDEKGGLKQIKRICGMKGGVVIATLSALGYTPQSIEELIATFTTPFFPFSKVDIEKMHKNHSYKVMGEPFLEWIKNAIFKATGIIDCTFGELKALIQQGKPFKHLYLLGMKEKEQTILRLNSEDKDWDTLVIADAVRIAIAVPPFTPHFFKFKQGSECIISQTSCIAGEPLGHPAAFFDFLRYIQRDCGEAAANLPQYNPRTLVLNLLSPSKIVNTDKKNNLPLALMQGFQTATVEQENLYHAHRQLLIRSSALLEIESKEEKLSLKNAGEAAVITLLRRCERGLLRPFANQIGKIVNLKEPFKGYVSVLHHDELLSYRKNFEKLPPLDELDEIKKFQKSAWISYKAFITLLLEDAFAIVGPPSCGYDIRFLNSSARHEVTYRLELHLLILVEDAEHIDYFRTLSQVLQGQIAFLDKAEIKIKNYINTPTALAAESPVNGPEHCLLFSRSLQCSEPKLYKIFQHEVKKHFPESRRHQKALEKLQKHIQEHKTRWPKSIEKLKAVDLDEQLVEPFYSFLDGLSVYYGIEGLPYERIDKLKVFTQKSRDLLKEVSAKLYLIKVRNSKNPQLAINAAEWRVLKKVYWIVLESLCAIRMNASLLSEVKSIDLYKILFDHIDKIKDQASQFEAITAFVSSLVEKNTSQKTHLKYYKRLSTKEHVEHLRKAYLDSLKSSKDPGIFRKLLHHPNARGVRQVEREARDNFIEELKRALVDHEEQGKYGYSVHIEGPKLSGTWYLKQDVVNQLLDLEGNIHKDHKHCMNRVGYVENQQVRLHFKQQPLSAEYAFHPGVEQAASRLMMRVCGHGVSISELMKFVVKHPDKMPRSYLVLVSQTVVGNNLSNTSTEELQQLDQKRLSDLFLSVPLILPGDLREANYIFTEAVNEDGRKIKQLVSVDNDISWVKVMTKHPLLIGRYNIHLFFVLFFKFPTMVLDPQAIEEFLALKPAILIEDWLKEMCVWNQQAKEHFQEFENLAQGFSSFCLFDKGTATQLLIQFFRLQTFLKENNGRQILADEVLKILLMVEEGDLIDIGPRIHNEYQKAKSLKGTPGENIKTLTGRPSSTVSLSLTQSQAAMFNKVPSSQGEKDLNLPERALKEIEQLIALHFQDFYFIQGKETAKLERGFTPTPEGALPDLTTQKEVLRGLLMHKYDKLNLSHCHALTDADLRKFILKSGSTLTHLDLRHCRGITDEPLWFIAEKCLLLEELYLSNCEKIVKFSTTKFLVQRIPLQFPNLKIVHIASCPLLEEILLSAPQLHTLKADHNSKLKKVEVASLYEPNVNTEECPAAIRRLQNNGIPAPYQSISTLKKQRSEKPHKSSSSVLIEGASEAETLMLTWLETLKFVVPGILKSIKKFAKDRSNEQVLDYIQELVPDDIKMSIKEFADQNQGTVSSDCLKDFYLYLLAASLAVPIRKTIETKLSASPSLFEGRRLFTADMYDYRKTDSRDSRDTIELPKIPTSTSSDIERLHNYIEANHATLEKVEGKHLISIIGPTGSGKSTEINHLYGCTMLERRSNKGTHVVAENPVVTIGHGTKSETYIPEAVVLPNSESVLCDMPGFKDTRKDSEKEKASVIAIANAVNIRNTFAQAESNRILLLINGSLLQNRALDLRDGIEMLISLFGSVEKLNLCTGSIIVGISRLSQDMTFEGALEITSEIAKEMKWDLSNHLAQIILMNPLDASNRDEVLRRLEALPRLEGSAELYSTALAASDLLLLQDIAEAISKTIEQCWALWDMQGIIKEYNKLSSLECIKHAAIEKVLNELSTGILKRIQDLITEIHLNMYPENETPAHRIKIKELMPQLEACGVLDACFPATPERISHELKKLKLSLEKNESEKQSAINSRIEEDVSLLIKELEEALSGFLEKEHRSLAGINPTLEGLYEQFKLGAVENLQFALLQIDREIQVRPDKYYFGDVQPLQGLKDQKQQIIENLLIEAVTKAQILEQQERFEKAFQSLFEEYERVLTKKYGVLSQRSISTNDFALIAEYGFDRRTVEEIVSAVQKLKDLNKETLKPLKERISLFLEKVYRESTERQKQADIDQLVSTIQKLLLTPLNNSTQLNLSYAQLAQLDNNRFQELKQQGWKVLIHEPREKLEQLVVNEMYRFSLEALLRAMHVILLLPECIPAAEAKATLESINLNIKQREMQRRTAELHRFQHVLPTLFEEAQANIRKYVLNNFIEVHGWGQLEAEQFLERFTAKVNLINFMAIRKDLMEAVKTEGQRYAFVQDKLMIKIKQQNHEALLTFFNYISAWIEALYLAYQIDQFLPELQKEADSFDDPDLIIEKGIAAGFSSKRMQIFSQHMRDLTQLSARNQRAPEIVAICRSCKEKMMNFNEKVIQDARTKRLAGLLNILKKAIIHRTYLNIIDQLPTMLITVRDESPENYANITEDLVESINAWQASPEHESSLKSGDFQNVVSTFVTLIKLSEVLRDFLEIDTSDLSTTILNHIGRLFKLALDEIKELIESEKYFDLHNLKSYLSVSTTFKSHKFNLGGDENTLQVTAIKKWRDVIGYFQQEYAHANYENRQKLLLNLTKEMIKSYAVAKEISRLDDFIRVFQKALRNVQDNAGGLIYQLGVQISTFKHHDASIMSAAQGIIHDFPEFKRINTEGLRKKTGQVKFKNALRDLSCIGGSEDTKDVLKGAYKECHTLFKEALAQIAAGAFDAKQHVEETKNLARQLSSYATSLYNHRSKAVKLLANIFAQWTYQDSISAYFTGESNTLMQPLKTQILAILRLIAIDDPKGFENHLAQVKTGEGKSIALGFTATFFGLLGYEVHVVCYSSYLSARDKNAFKKLLETYALQSIVTYSTIYELANAVLGNTLPPFRIFTKAFLDGKSVNSFVEKKRKRLLLIDEVDVFFGENFYGKTDGAAVAIHSAQTEELLRYVWKEKSSLRAKKSDEAVQELLNQPFTQKLLQDYPRLDPFLKHEIAGMITALYYFPDSGEIYGNALVVNNQIGYLDNAGNIEFNISSYQTTFSYFYWREKGKITSDEYLKQSLSITITCARTLYSELPKFFDLRLGLTATLEGLCEEEKTILKDYAFDRWSLIPSTYVKKPLKRNPTLVIPGLRNQEYFAAIKKEIEQTKENNRACLAIFANTKLVNEFRDYLATFQRLNFSTPEVLTEMVPDEERSAIIARAISQYKVTLMTAVFGRGIDFICHDSALVEAGGVHIILTYYPLMKTEEIQIEGRTCRQDDPGSIRKILLAADLLDQELVPGKYNDEYKRIADLHEFMPAEGGEPDWDAILNERRQTKYSERFAKINKTLEENKKQHQKSIDLAYAIQNGNSALALTLLKEFNGCT